MQNIVKAVQKVFGYRGKNHLEVRDDDVFLVAYPRSGSSWVRRLVAKSVYPGREWGVENIDEVFPDIYQVGKDLKYYESPRYIKSHEAYNNKYQKVVYLYRDCRDVFTSYYNFERTVNGYEGSKADFLNRFIEGRVTYGRWDNHIKSWLFDNEVNQLHTLSYEKLHNNTKLELEQLLDFMSINVKSKKLLKSIESNSFDKHKKDVQENSVHAENGYEGGLSGGPRKGGSLLSSQHEKKILSEMGGVMEKLGYTE